MKTKLSMNDLRDVRGKTIFMRVDYNVPLDNGTVSDDKRIKATTETIDQLVKAGAKIVLASHLGRPKGQRDPNLSLRAVAARAADVLGTTVNFADDCVGDKVQQLKSALQPGQILLLENLRFHPEEEKNDRAFAEQLAAGIDIYINDAFGAAHRAHASTAAVPEIVKRRGGQAVAGLLMQKELEYLGKTLENPERPFVSILGGAKISGKIDVLTKLLDIADVILIGGAMAYTFRKSQGFGIGNSLVENDKLDVAKDVLAKAKAKGKKLLLPLDQIQTTKIAAGSPTRVTDGPSIEDGWEGVDIGPQTIAAYKKEIAKARTVIWNGPMGVFEIPDFSKGTFEVAKAVAENSNCTSIIGGGDSAKAVKMAGVADQMTFISTGGGASLEFLEGKELPGVAALSDK